LSLVTIIAPCVSSSDADHYYHPAAAAAANNQQPAGLNSCPLPAARRPPPAPRPAGRQGALLQGYFQYVALTTAKAVWTAAVGPLLGPASSGPIIQRTASEVLFGYRDPLLVRLLPRVV
jgi:hypothetical protein